MQSTSTRILVFFTATLMSTTVLANIPAEKVGVVGSANVSAFAVNVQKERRSLKVGDDIYLNDTIETDGKGAAQIMFLDKSALTVNPNSAITIDTFVYNPAASTGQMTLNSAKGAMRFIGGALSKKEPVSIKTPVATIGIRGGIADVNVDAKTGKTDSVFVYGKEMSTENAGGERTVTTQFGTGFSVLSGNTPPRPMDTAAIANNISSFHEQTAAGSNPSANPESKEVDQRVGTIGSGSASPASETSPSAPAGEQGSNAGSGGGNSANSDSGNSNNEPGNPSGENAASGNAANNAPGNDPSNTSNPPQSDSAANGNTSSAGGRASEGNPVRPGAGLGEGRGTPLATAADRAAGFTGNTPALQGGALGGLPVPQNITNTAAQDGTRLLAENPPANPTNPPPTNTQPTTPLQPTAGGNPPPPSGALPPPPLNAVLPPPPVTTSTTTTSTSSTTSSGGSGGGSGGGSTTSSTTGNYRGLTTYIKSSAPNVIDEQGSNTLGLYDGDTKLKGTVNTSTGLVDLTLDRTTGTGYKTGLTGRAVDTVTNQVYNYTGDGYVSENNSMYYYRIKELNNDQLALITGNRLAYSEIAGAASRTASSANYAPNGITYYDFLPDLYKYQDVTVASAGFFDFNRADVSLNPSGNTVYAAGNRGLMVDWNNGSYISGNLLWSAIGQSGLKTTFGKVNTSAAAGGDVLAGKLVNFKSEYDYAAASATAVESVDGNTHVRNDIYGQTSATSTIDGMLLEGAFGPSNTQIRTPVTLKANPANVIPASAQRSNGTHSGYVGGVFVENTQNNGAARVPVRILNTTPDKVTITRDTSNNTIGASIEASSIDSTLTVKGTFGQGAPNTPQQAFLKDNVYAMGQGDMKYGPSTPSTDYIDATKGVMVSGAAVNGAPSPCPNCAYAHWGVWAGDLKKDATIKNAANMIPYVAGQKISSTELTALVGTNPGVVTYTGGVVATKVSPTTTTISNLQGTLSTDIDLTNRTVNTMTLDMSAAVPGLTLVKTTGSPNTAISTDGTFTAVPLALSSAAATTLGGGGANGALYGDQAQNVGGNFSANIPTGSVTVTGVYLGKRP